MRRPAPVPVIVTGQEEETERVANSGGAAWVVLILTAAGLGLSVFWFGLPLYIPVAYGLACAAVILRAESPAGGVAVGYLMLGLGFATVMFGFWAWPTALAGVLAVTVIAAHVFTRRGVDVATGDPNPVYYAVIVVATRGWLALVYSGVAQVTTTSFSAGSWISLFVFGTLPDLPVLANVIIALVLNGTLLFAVPWWIKRLVLPS